MKMKLFKENFQFSVSVKDLKEEIAEYSLIVEFLFKDQKSSIELFPRFWQEIIETRKTTMVNRVLHFSSEDF